ncbi:MAG: riboflavin synthase [Patescibacteria group bacterium]|nr:riboflavin synthase [Patescibacteria group bacterium]
MFSGIVEKMGELKKIENRLGKIYFTIKAGGFLRGVKIGSSVACDGACLTAVKLAGGNFTVELMPETLRMTKFSQAKVGDLINLEKSLKVGDRISGHFVMGHVDAVGVVARVEKLGADVSLTVKVPKKIIKYLAYKGSVSINGVSLTIGENGAGWFKVYLIGHTLKITNLGKLKTGDQVNIEVDTIARYLEGLLKSKK